MPTHGRLCLGSEAAWPARRWHYVSLAAQVCSVLYHVRPSLPLKGQVQTTWSCPLTSQFAGKPDLQHGHQALIRAEGHPTVGMLGPRDVEAASVDQAPNGDADLELGGHQDVLAIRAPARMLHTCTQSTHISLCWPSGLAFRAGKASWDVSKGSVALLQSMQPGWRSPAGPSSILQHHCWSDTDQTCSRFRRWVVPWTATSKGPSQQSAVACQPA